MIKARVGIFREIAGSCGLITPLIVFWLVKMDIVVCIDEWQRGLVVKPRCTCRCVWGGQDR